MTSASSTSELSGTAPVVSVVIVNWNTRDLLAQALESLHRETTDVTFETIVVDNGSTDGSVELVERRWSQVRLVALPGNLGFSVGNNRGLDEARGTYVLLLNSDTIVLQSTLAGMARFLDAHPDAGCVGARHLNADGSLQRSMDAFPGLIEDFLIYTEIRRLPWLRPFLERRYPWWGDHDHAREVDWVNGACLMVRREVIERLGGFDEEHFIYAEEIDWCYRMHQAGWRVYFTPEAEVIHLGGRSTERLVRDRVVLLYESQYWFYRKHYPLWKYAVLRLIVTAVGSVRVAILAALCLASRGTAARWPKRMEVLTGEPVAAEPCIMLEAWLRILRLPWHPGRRFVSTDTKPA
jgi:hypothetical protein